ncbi:MAG: DNA-3-methyladenine glycosylase [Candidatus Yanofskybacteria bacterium]|nr:DNA-3-methyladenine glycosylase [Candidatus Yanofskybacteria bacterium]
MRLTSEFFNRDTVTVARELLGKYLVRRMGNKVIAAKITETEAYCGPDDLASHASKGLTNRTKLMFGPPGFTYVYLIYGMYHCLNFVTEAPGFPAAVLVRGVELPHNQGNGPGKLCREFKIDKDFNGLPSGNKKLWIEDRKEEVPNSHIKVGKRIGIEYAGDWQHKLWRFTLKK